MEEGKPPTKVGWDLVTLENLIFNVQKVDENIKGDQPTVVYRSLSRLEDILTEIKDGLINDEIDKVLTEEAK